MKLVVYNLGAHHAHVFRDISVDGRAKLLRGISPFATERWQPVLLRALPRRFVRIRGLSHRGHQSSESAG